MGNGPSDWPDENALGPFTSEAKARAAIREHLDESLDDCETLSPGADAEWAMQYHIMEMVKSFQPVVTAKVSVSLSSARGSKEDSKWPSDAWFKGNPRATKKQ